ncbi:uncharacterized protein LOC114302397 [Camellia sinensis]|uniref:uncharacterized protein LOC114302397 n=1 Tax=Camellia sinensis TaxID=4442 RepID=UPI0010365A41|nr:uncharacterized protein LOC114302397 [Camellia sinensis]
MNEVVEKQIQAIRTDFQSRIQSLESQLQAAGVPVDPVVAPSNPLHRQLWIHLVVIPLFGQCHINNNLMHFHPKRFTFQRKRRRIRRRRRRRRRRTNKVKVLISLVHGLCSFDFGQYCIFCKLK